MISSEPTDKAVAASRGMKFPNERSRRPVNNPTIIIPSEPVAVLMPIRVEPNSSLSRVRLINGKVMPIAAPMPATETRSRAITILGEGLRK